MILYGWKPRKPYGHDAATAEYRQIHENAGVALLELNRVRDVMKELASRGPFTCVHVQSETGIQMLRVSHIMRLLAAVEGTSDDDGEPAGHDSIRPEDTAKSRRPDRWQVVIQEALSAKYNDGFEQAKRETQAYQEWLEHRNASLAAELEAEAAADEQIRREAHQLESENARIRADLAAMTQVNSELATQAAHDKARAMDADELRRRLSTAEQELLSARRRLVEQEELIAVLTEAKIKSRFPDWD